MAEEINFFHHAASSNVEFCAGHVWAACYAIFISFCVQNKQQRKGKSKKLEGFSYPIFSGFMKFAQLCCFVFGMMKSCCRKNEKFKPKIPSSIVCVLSGLLSFLFAPNPNYSKFDLFMKEKWWKIWGRRKKVFYFIRQISPGAYHVQRKKCAELAASSAMTRKNW